MPIAKTIVKRPSEIKLVELSFEADFVNADGDANDSLIDNNVTVDVYSAAPLALFDGAVGTNTEAILKLIQNTSASENIYDIHTLDRIVLTGVTKTLEVTDGYIVADSLEVLQPDVSFRVAGGVHGEDIYFIVKTGLTTMSQSFEKIVKVQVRDS